MFNHQLIQSPYQSSYYNNSNCKKQEIEPWKNSLLKRACRRMSIGSEMQLVWNIFSTKKGVISSLNFELHDHPCGVSF